MLKLGENSKVNRFSEPHKIPIGSLVALGDGTKVYVVGHTRNYDGEPLYKLSAPKYEKSFKTGTKRA